MAEETNFIRQTDKMSPRAEWTESAGDIKENFAENIGQHFRRPN